MRRGIPVDRKSLHRYNFIFQEIRYCLTECIEISWCLFNFKNLVFLVQLVKSKTERPNSKMI